MENAQLIKPQLSEFGLNPKDWIIMPQSIKGAQKEISSEKGVVAKYLCVHKTEPWFQLELETTL